MFQDRIARIETKIKEAEKKLEFQRNSLDWFESSKNFRIMCAENTLKNLKANLEYWIWLQSHQSSESAHPDESAPF